MCAYCEGLTTLALIELGEITKKQARILLYQERKGQAGFLLGK